MMPLHPPDKDRTQTFDEDADCIVWADNLGFTEAWIGQHHTAGWEPIPSNDIFIGINASGITYMPDYPKRLPEKIVI